MTDAFSLLSKIGESRAGTRVFRVRIPGVCCCKLLCEAVVASQFVCCWPRRPSGEWYGDVVMILG